MRFSILFLEAVAPEIPFRAQNAPGSDSLRRVSDSVQDFLRSQPGSAVVLLVVLMLVLGLAVFYALLRPELARRRRVSECLDRLVQAHGLDAAQRRALRRLAARAGLDNPALLFVRRSLLEQFGQELPPGMLEALRARLYG